MAEDLALDERLGNGRTVDRDEGLRPARARSCSVRATSSLPVPLSPVMSTDTLEGAICSMSVKISRICGELPHQ